MKHTRRSLVAAVGAALAVVAASLGAGAASAPDGVNHPVGVGPTSSTHGFPVWYRDATGLRLEGCNQAEDPLCAVPAGEMPNPDAPTTWPDNFPLENFYFLAGAEVPVGTAGRAVYTAGVEATFNTDTPVDGEQITFGRVRIVVRGALPNTRYTFTHPYGVDELVTDGSGSARLVEDIGIGTPGDFTGALKSRVGPFLRWTGADAPAGYVGDPGILHEVSGSVWVDSDGLRQNYFRASGAADDSRTTQFSLVGRLATNAGVTGVAAVDNPSQSTIDVYATSEPGQGVQVKGTSQWPTTPMGSNEGAYFARVAYEGDRPTTVSVVNAGDQPPSVKLIPVTDGVTITRATYDADTDELVVEARSTDAAATLTGTGTTTTEAPPAKVVVTSSGGGSAQAAVDTTGAASPGVTVTAAISANPLVAPGATVVLDGSPSIGDITGYAWSQTAGAPIALTTDGSQASFVAPAAADATVEITLTVTGFGGGTATTRTTVTTQAGPPIANAGADQQSNVGAPVTLDGTRSTLTTSYTWRQTGGPTVTLTGADTARPSFTMPAAVVTFELTATGPGGTATDTVAVSPRLDLVTVTSARFDGRKAQWRVTGTATVTAGNKVTVHAGSTTAGAVIGTASVLADGTWEVRVAPSPVPVNTRVTVESSAGAPVVTAQVR